MKAELAERLLGRVMGWDTSQLREHVPDLQVLAEVKYDEYGNYRAGSKFVENLAAWLAQLPEGRRELALDFVEHGLVFVSEIEITQLINRVPATIVERVLRERIARKKGIPAHRVAEIHRDGDYSALRRRSLILGASDGARLDRLRRASLLSHEQFLQTIEPSPRQLEKLGEAIGEALGPDVSPTFQHVFVVDDFSGSGFSLLRRENDGRWGGKVARLYDILQNANEVVDDVPGTIVLYVASEQAIDHLEEALEAAGLGHWSVQCAQRIPSWMKVDRQFPEMIELCRGDVRSGHG